MTTEHAFPQALQAGDLAQATGGMTLRDYFAAKAMQALIEKYDESPVEISLEAYEFADAMLKAEDSFAIADAMLAERAK